MIKKIFLYSIAISCVFLLIQGVKTGFDVNSIKNKITDSINNVNEDSSNNNDNNSGNTTNVSAYSNLVVSEQAPEDSNSIWVKSNNNITNVEYSEKALFDCSDSYSFEKFADCNNESYFNNFNENCIIENGYIYIFTQDSNNFYIKIIDKNKNLINDITINQSHSSMYVSFAMSEDYYFILDGYNSNLYKYSRIDNSMISCKNYSFNAYDSTYKYNCMYYCKNNNCLYIDFYHYRPYINIIDLTDDSLNKKFNFDSSSSNSSEQSYKHNRFIGEFDGYIYVQSYRYVNRINIEDNSYSSVLISNFNKTDYKCIFFIKNEYIYNYSINYTNNIVSGSDNTSQCYYLSEKIFNLYDNSFVKENCYYLDSTCNGSDYYIYFDNFKENFDIYIYSYSNTSYKYIYKLSKKPVQILNNTLYINDSKYNNVFNSNPIYIKFNNVFGYKLYSPKFYLANSSGNLIKVNAYIYNTNSNLWELI